MNKVFPCAGTWYMLFTGTQDVFKILASGLTLFIKCFKDKFEYQLKLEFPRIFLTCFGIPLVFSGLRLTVLGL